MGDIATLITAIGGAVAAILGPIVTLVVMLRRVSPKERSDAAQEIPLDLDTVSERLKAMKEIQERLKELQDAEEPE